MIDKEKATIKKYIKNEYPYSRVTKHGVLIERFDGDGLALCESWGLSLSEVFCSRGTFESSLNFGATTVCEAGKTCLM